MNTKETMNSAGAEIEDAEILEAEVVGTPRSARAGKLSGTALLLALAALIVALGGGLYSYESRRALETDLLAFDSVLEAARKQANELNRQLSEAQSSFQARDRQLVQQQQALAEQKELLANQGATLEQERARLEQVSRQVRAAMQSVQRRTGGDNSHWMAAEAAYLIQLAGHRLHLEGDVQTAIRALETADARLRDSGDPGWLPVREILALEIGTLKGVGPVDIEGLALQLSGLAAGAKDLKLSNTRPVSAAPGLPADGAQADAGERSLKTLLRDGWEGFKSIMVIRHHGQPVGAMLPPDQQFLLQQNFRLQLEAARISLLRGNQALYDSSLGTAARLLREYYDSGDARTQSYLKELDLLSKLRVRPRLPDISASLVALREQLRQPGDNL